MVDQHAERGDWFWGWEQVGSEHVNRCYHHNYDQKGENCWGCGRSALADSSLHHSDSRIALCTPAVYQSLARTARIIYERNKISTKVVEYFLRFCGFGGVSCRLHGNAASPINSDSDLGHSLR